MLLLFLFRGVRGEGVQVVASIPRVPQLNMLRVPCSRKCAPPFGNMLPKQAFDIVKDLELESLFPHCAMNIDSTIKLRSLGSYSDFSLKTWI